MKLLSTTMFQFRTEKVVLLNRQQTNRIRTEYTRQLRQQFKDHAFFTLQGSKNVVDNVYGLEVHHIRPIALGGTNSFANLALVTPELHVEIHEELNNQTYGMRHGSTRYIDIPYMQGKLWGLNRE